MKRLILLLAAFISITASAQTFGYDELNISIGDITGSDTILYPEISKIKNCMGNFVIMRFTIQNTDATTDSLLYGGRDDDVSYDYDDYGRGKSNFEPLNHSSIPFIIDTTDTDLTGLSFTYDSEGEYYWVSFSKSGFPYKLPGIKITKSALTTGDIRVYFYNLGTHGEGNLDSDATISSNDTISVTTVDTINTKSLSYDAATGSDQVVIINPEWAHRTTTTEIISETNLDTDSTYYAFSMDTYNHALVYWFLSGGATLTVYVSPDEDADATDETTGDWIDAGTDLLGGASVSDEDNYFVIDTPKQFEKVLIKVETSDATNSISVWEKRYR